MDTLCECGCGQPAPIAKYTASRRGWRKGQFIRFIQGHNSRFIARSRRDRIVDSQGYIRVSNPDHPHAYANGYILEHRLVMEAKLGRYLSLFEVVHHINHNKQDNRPENLEVLTRGVHSHRHPLSPERRQRLLAGRDHWRASLPIKTCSVSDCDIKHYSSGLCSLHYRRQVKYGNPYTLLKERQPATCGVQGCEGRGYSRSLCQRHYNAWYQAHH